MGQSAFANKFGTAGGHDEPVVFVSRARTRSNKQRRRKRNREREREGMDAVGHQRLFCVCASVNKWFVYATRPAHEGCVKCRPWPSQIKKTRGTADPSHIWTAPPFRPARVC